MATYTLTGPAAITHTQIATALTAAIGRDVTFTDVPPQVSAAGLFGAVLSYLGGIARGPN